MRMMGLALVLGLHGLGQPVFAAYPTDFDLVNMEWLWVGMFQIGSLSSTTGTQQTLSLAPNIVKTYVPSKLSKSMMDAGLFIGQQYNLSDIVLGQFGFAVDISADYQTSGVIWDDADPDFDNYSYNYKIQHFFFAGEARLLLDLEAVIMPFISGAIGIGINRASAYTNTPLIDTAVANAPFADKSMSSVSYTAIIGLETSLTQAWQLGIGYEYADWGKSQLGLAPAQTRGGGLIEKHVKTHGLMANVTALF